MPENPIDRDFKLNVITTTDPKGGQILKFIDAIDAIAEHLAANVTVMVIDDLKLWQDRLPSFQPRHIQLQVLSYPVVLTQQKAIIFAATLSTQQADLVIDPDMHPSLGVLPDIIALLHQGVPLVHCQRPDRHTATGFRQLSSSLYGLIFRLTSGCALHDANTPMVAYNHSSLRQAANHNIGAINPRIYLYCQYRHLFHTVYLNSDGVTHPSHYRFFALLNIFTNQLWSALRIRWRLSMKKDTPPAP